MALADYVVQRRDVTDFGGNIIAQVRGLNFEDISQLVRNHLTELTLVFASFSQGGKLLPEALDIHEMIFRLVVKTPETAAKMLAFGCDEPNEIEKAKSLPAPLQVKMIGEIIALTFEDVGGPLEFLAMVRMAMASQPLVSDVPESSTRVMQ